MTGFQRARYISSIASTLGKHRWRATSVPPKRIAITQKPRSRPMMTPGPNVSRPTHAQSRSVASAIVNGLAVTAQGARPALALDDGGLATSGLEASACPFSVGNQAVITSVWL